MFVNLVDPTSDWTVLVLVDGRAARLVVDVLISRVLGVRDASAGSAAACDAAIVVFDRVGDRLTTDPTSDLRSDV